MNNLEIVKRNVLEVLNVKALNEFVVKYADEKIGELPSLRLELAETCRLVAAADIDEGINYYRSFSARNYVELTVDEREANALRKYKRAAAKVCWLASVAKAMTGTSFLNVRINKAEKEDCVKLVEAFAFYIRHPHAWEEME